MKNVFLFYGPETFLSKDKLRLWKKIFIEKHGISGFTSIDCQSHEEQTSLASTLRHTLQQPSLFQKNSFTIISHLSSLKNTETIDSVLLLSQSLPQMHVVVFFEEDILDSHSFFKKCRDLEKKDCITFEYFEPLREMMLIKWIVARAVLHGSTISQNNAQYLIQILSPAKLPFSKEANMPPLWNIEQELKKLCSYRQGKEIDISHIKDLVSFQLHSHLFDLTDALLGNSIQITFSITRNLLHVPKSAIRKEALSITGFLISQFRSFLLLKTMEEQKLNTQEIGEKLSWNPKRLWVVSRKIQYHSSQSFATSYSLLLRLDSDLKTYFLDPPCSLERTLLSIHALLTKKSSF